MEKFQLVLPGKKHSHAQLCKTPLFKFNKSVFEEGKKSNRWIRILSEIIFLTIVYDMGLELHLTITRNVFSRNEARISSIFSTST